MTPRLLLYGLLAGILFSAMRAPLGLDWTQLSAVDPGTSTFFRAGALFAVALFLDARRKAFRRGVPVWLLLFAIALGYAFHAFVLATRWQPTTRLGYVLLLVAATILLWRTAGSPGGAESETDVDEAIRAPISLFQRFGIVLASAGAALAWENLAHHVRLLGLGLPEDESVIGTVFLLALAIGAVSFGALLSNERRRPVVLAVGLTITSAATLVGLIFIGGMGPDPLFRYLRKFDLDPSTIGTWYPTALLAGASMVVPAFLCGTALTAGRHAASLSSVALGAAVGLILRPYAVDTQAQALAFPNQAATPWAWNILVVATVLAVIGALVVVAKERGAARIVGIALCLLAVAAPWLRPRLVVWSFSPWFSAPIRPELVMPTSVGIVTVEPVGGAGTVVTLDRRRVSPTDEEQRVDALRIHHSLALLEDEKRAKARVLFVGQMTPARAMVLGGIAGLQLERTAIWFRALEPVEKALFGSQVPPGELVSPVEARRRIADGAYDLVLVMPVHGPVLSVKSQLVLPTGSVEAPVLSSLDVPQGSLAVAWLDASSPLSRRDLGDRVVLAMDRFRFLSLGIVRGDVPEPDLNRPTLFPTGEPEARLGALSLLRVFPRQRLFVLQAALCARLARAAEGSDVEYIARGLALHYGAQKPSSPFETLAQQTEMEEEAVRSFYEGVTRGAYIDLTMRQVWLGVAWLLTEKRMPDLALAYLEGVANAYAPWPAIDRAVGQAYREFLDPEEALSYFERALAAEPNDIALLVTCSELALEDANPKAAVDFLRRALTIQPDRFDLERALGIALIRAGDPEGRRLLERLQRENPADDSIAPYLEEGPYLPPPGGSGSDLDIGSDSGEESD